MEFRKTNILQLNLKKEQAQNLSPKSKIKQMLKQKDVLAFNIYDNDTLIGFAMLKEFDKNKFFLWDYIIEYNYQNKGFGTMALKELINLLKTKYNCKIITTTYKFGNLPAKRLYEKLGFIETSIVDTKEVHEINMMLQL